MTWVKKTNLRGTDGKTGPANRLSIGTVVSAPEARAVIRGLAPNQILDLEVPRGPQGLPGLNAVPADEAVAGFILGPGKTADALAALGPDNGARAVGKGELIVNAKDFGAIGDGVTNDAAAINAAAEYADALAGDAKLLIPTGVYYIGDTTVNIRCQLDADGATLNYDGVGTALIIGSIVSGVNTPRRKYILPRVVKTNRASGWDGTSTGVQLNNLNTCFIEVPFIRDFEMGLRVYGYGAGNAYNNIYLGTLWENHKNLVIDTDAGGYSNQHTIYGGRLQHSLTKGAIANDPEACQIYMVNVGTGGANNCTFINTSIEGENVGQYRVQVSGRYNTFFTCRWESGQPRIRYRAGAQFNVIYKGYNSQSIEEVWDTGSIGGGEIVDYYGGYTNTTGAGGQTIPDNAWTRVNAWGSDVGRRIALSPNGVWKPRPGRWMFFATITFVPNGAGRRIARLMMNSTSVDLTEAAATAGSTARTSLKLAGSISIPVGGEVTVDVMQTSGTPLDLESAGSYVKFRAEYLGAS